MGVFKTGFAHLEKRVRFYSQRLDHENLSFAKTHQSKLTEFSSYTCVSESTLSKTLKPI